MELSIFLNLLALLEQVNDFNNRNTFLTAKLLKQGYQNHKLCNASSKIVSTLNRSKNIMSLCRNFCNKKFLMQNSLEIWYIKRKSFEIKFSLIFQTYRSFSWCLGWAALFIVVLPGPIIYNYFLTIFCDCITRIVSDLVGNTEDRFSHDTTHMFTWKRSYPFLLT